MGIEHERIHLETSSVLIRQLPIEMVNNSPKGWNYSPFGIKNNFEFKNEMIRVNETKVRMGKSVDAPSYGWDLDYGSFECTYVFFKINC
jgi:hypothetical protein